MPQPPAILRPARLSAALLAVLLSGACLPSLDEFPLAHPTGHAGDAPHTLMVGGTERRYLLHLPPGDLWSAPHPLVLMLHGTGSSARQMPEQTGFDDAADPRGVIVAYPDGSGKMFFSHTWHTGRCCGYAEDHQVEDVTFIQALIEELRRQLDIDSTRIFIAGFSDGAMMTFRLGCELAGEVAAIAPVSGRMPDVPCNPARPLPVITFGGTDDAELRYDHDRYTHAGSFPYAFSLQASVEYWVATDHCDPYPAPGKLGEHRWILYAPCDGATEVELYTVNGGQHAWPGGRKGWIFSPPPVDNLDATNLILDFFQRHPLVEPSAAPPVPVNAAASPS